MVLAKKVYQSQQRNAVGRVNPFFVIFTEHFTEHGNQNLVVGSLSKPLRTPIPQRQERRPGNLIINMSISSPHRPAA